jgi:hypothetical protein
MLSLGPIEDILGLSPLYLIDALVRLFLVQAYSQGERQVC